MATNTHTFEKGEEFNGQIDDEKIMIRNVSDHTVTYDYIVENETLGRRTIEKGKARTLIQSGAWSSLLVEN